VRSGSPVRICGAMAATAFVGWYKRPPDRGRGFDLSAERAVVIGKRQRGDGRFARMRWR